MPPRALALALALLAGTCAPAPPAPTPPVVADAVPVAPVVPVPVAPVVVVPDEPAPLVPAVPTLAAGTCVLGDSPTHHLVVTADGRTLDDIPLGRDASLADAIQAWGDDRTLSLAIPADFGFFPVHSLLVDLQSIPRLRLWIAVRVGDDPQLRHLPILPTRLGTLTYIVGLPPRNYTLRLDGDREDPYILPSTHARIDQLLVVPDHDSTWQAVAAALAIPCGSATLIEQPLIPPPSSYPSSVRLGPVKANRDAGYQNLVRRIVRAHGNEIRWCYDTNRRRDPRIRGRVTIAFTIDALGKVTAAAIAESTLGDNDIAECVRIAARRWKFVKPEDGREIEARFTWELSPP